MKIERYYIDLLDDDAKTLCGLSIPVEHVNRVTFIEHALKILISELIKNPDNVKKFRNVKIQKRSIGE